MKDLLIQTAKRTGAINAEALSRYFDANAEDTRRLDELRKSELPDAADLDILKQLEENDSENE